MACIIDRFSLPGSLLQYTLSTEDIKIKHEVGKSLKQFWGSSERSGAVSRLSCAHSPTRPGAGTGATG